MTTTDAETVRRLEAEGRVRMVVDDDGMTPEIVGDDVEEVCDVLRVLAEANRGDQHLPMTLTMDVDPDVAAACGIEPEKDDDDCPCGCGCDRAVLQAMRKVNAERREAR